MKDVCLTPRDLADDIPRSFKISNRWPKENGFGRNKVCREKSAEGIVSHRLKALMVLQSVPL